MLLEEMNKYGVNQVSSYVTPTAPKLFVRYLSSCDYPVTFAKKICTLYSRVCLPKALLSVNYENTSRGQVI